MLAVLGSKMALMLRKCGLALLRARYDIGMSAECCNLLGLVIGICRSTDGSVL